MHIRDVMTTEVRTIPITATYEDAARLLHDAHLSGAPVMDGDRVVGILADKDLYKGLYPYYRSFAEDPTSYLDHEAREMKMEEIRHMSVEHFMTKDVLCAHPDEPVMRAGAVMLAHHVHRLPVMEDGKLIGIVTRADIYRMLVVHHLFGSK